VVVVVVNVDEQTAKWWGGRMSSPARGVGRGCRAVRGSGAQGVLAAVLDAEISVPTNSSPPRAAIQSAVKRVILDRTGRHPMIIPAITLL